MGAAWAVVGCLLGNVFAIIALIMQKENVSFFRVLSVRVTQPSLMVQSVASIFSHYDLLFVGFAMYEAFRFSLRTVTQQERESLLCEKPRAL